MEVKGFLIINSNKSCRFVKNKVNLNWNEISIAVNISLPDTLFSRPMLKANIELKGDFENEFDFEVKQNLKDLIESQENLHLVNIEILNNNKKNETENK